MKISVIVPVYNVENYLEKCLTSLAKQTFKSLEIIIVNDGTKDNSQNIIDKFVKKYKNMKSFIKENGGLSDARNFGLTKATGEYIGFVDSDDYIDETMYEKLYEKIISNNFDVVVCDLYRVYGKKLILTSSNIKNDILDNKGIKKTMLDIYPTAWNKLYKKELFSDLEFKKAVWFEDVELLYRMFPKIKKIGVVKEPLYYYVQREGAITSTVNHKIYHYIDNWNSIIAYYKKNNLFEEYYKELEYSYVRYLYATFMKRVLAFEYKNFIVALNTAVKNVKNNFKNYRFNKYFYKSKKGLFLIMFSKPLALLIYKIKHFSI